MRTRRPTLKNTTLLLTALGTLGAASAAQARTLRVNNRADQTGSTFCTGAVTSPCTLRRVFELAEQNPSELFTVHLDPIGSYALNSQLVLRRGKVQLIGNTRDAKQMVIDGVKRTRVFLVAPDAGFSPRLEVRNLTIANGSVSTGERGGAVHVIAGGVFQATDAIIRDSVASLWGSGVSADGAGTSVSLTRTRVENNVNSQVGFCGGGVTSTGGGVAVTSGAHLDAIMTLFRGNKACRGAGLFAQDASLNLVASTFTENVADRRGAGIMIQGNGVGATSNRTARLRFNTIANNTALGGFHASELSYGAGLAVVGYSGNLILSGNIFAENQVNIPDSRITNAIQSVGHDCLLDDSRPRVDSQQNLFGTVGGQLQHTEQQIVFGGTHRLIANCVSLRTKSLAGIDSRRLNPKLTRAASFGSTGTASLEVMMPASDSLVNNFFRNATDPTHQCIREDGRGFLRPTFSAGMCEAGAAEIDGHSP